MLVAPEVFEEDVPNNLYIAHEDSMRLDFTHLLSADGSGDGFYRRFVNSLNRVVITGNGDENGIEISSDALDPGLVVVMGLHKQQLRLSLDNSEALFTSGLQVPRHYVVSELAGDIAKIVPLKEVVEDPSTNMPHRVRDILQPMDRLEVARFAYGNGYYYLMSLKDAADAA